MVLDTISPMFAASDFWMAKWLTPFWFIGVGILAGLVVLSLFLALAFLLIVPTRGLETARKNGTLHGVALAITALLGIGIGSLLNTGDFRRAFFVRGEFATEEWLLVSVALSAMTGAVVWALLFCSSSRFFGELRALLFEGVGLAMLITLGTVAAIGLAASPWVDNPNDIAASIPQMFVPQTRTLSFTLPVPILGRRQAPKVGGSVRSDNTWVYENRIQSTHPHRGRLRGRSTAFCRCEY